MKHHYFFKSQRFYLLNLLILTVFSAFNGFSNTENLNRKPILILVAPVIQDQNFNVVEGSIKETIVGTVSATAEGNITNYIITTAEFVGASNSPAGDSDQDPEYDAATVFSLNSETGVINVNNPKYLLAVLGPITLQVEVTDNMGEKASATITVNVTDIEVTISEKIDLDWTTAANHPQGHSEATGGALNGELYIFSGFTANFAPKASVFALNASRNSWLQLTDMPPMANNSGAGGATHMGWTDDGTNIYIAAGYAADASGNAQQFGARRVYKYIVAEDLYAELPSLPIDRSAGALEFLDNKLYYIAGTNRARNEDQGDLLMLDLNDLSSGWNYLSPMPNPRNHIGSAVYDGQLYIFGGQKEHDEELVPQDDVHRYDPATNKWTQMADMPQPFNHIHASVFVYGDYIYSIGGQIVHNATPYASVYAYNPATNTWSQFTDLPAKRFSIVAGGIDNNLYASGGNNSQTTYMANLPDAFLSTSTVQNTLNAIKVYPNPATNHINISMDDLDRTIESFSVYDLSGRMLKVFSAENFKNGNTFQLPVAQFSPGIYALVIKDTHGNAINKRFIIR